MCLMWSNLSSVCHLFHLWDQQSRGICHTLSPSLTYLSNFLCNFCVLCFGKEYILITKLREQCYRGTSSICIYFLMRNIYITIKILEQEPKAAYTLQWLCSQPGSFQHCQALQSDVPYIHT